LILLKTQKKGEDREDFSQKVNTYEGESCFCVLAFSYIHHQIKNNFFVTRKLISSKVFTVFTLLNDIQ